MILQRLKPILMWGVILFIFNYILLFVLMFLLGQKIGATFSIPFNFIASIVISYNGVLAYGKIGNKEKTEIINNTILAIVVGWMIVGVSALLFGLSSLLFSGEFDFRFPGILIGVIGGLLARQKLQGKKLKVFGITV